MKQWLCGLCLIFLFPTAAFCDWFPISTENLQSQIVVGKTYNNVAISIQNNTTGSVPITVSNIQTPEGFSVTSNSCNTTLAPGASCTLLGPGTYSPSSAGSGTATWAFTISDGVDFYPKTITRPLITAGVSGNVTTALPANIGEGNAEPILYTFTNSASTAATGVNVSLPEITGLNLTSNCGSSIAAGAVCTVSGTYTPPSSALGTSISVPVTLNDDQGSNITLTTGTTVTDVAIAGTVTTALSQNLHEGVPDGIVYTFTNNGAGTASDIAVSLPTITGLSLTTNCGATLAPNGVCTVSGTYTPPSSAVGTTVSVPVTLSYEQGANVTLTTSTTVDDIAVSGNITTPLASNVAEGVASNIVYTFTNGSSGEATGISVTLPTGIDGLSLNSSCGSTLPANGVCTVSGTYTPPAAAINTLVSIPVTLNYSQGSPVALTTSTNVADIAISGNAATPLPANLSEGVSANIDYTFTNGANGTATGVGVTLPTVTGLTFTGNTCGTTSSRISLAASATCQVTGTYQSPVIENDATISVPVTLSYAQGTDVTVTSETALRNIAVTGAVTTPLPTNLAEGVAANVLFTFTNTSSGTPPLTATGINVLTPVITGLSLTNGCQPPLALAQGASCTVSGTYTPAIGGPFGPINIPISLSYSQGANVVLGTGTTVIRFVTGAALAPIPSTMTAGQNVTFTARFTNTAGSSGGNATITGVNTPASTGVSGVTAVSSTCTNGATLAPGAFCNVTWRYIPATAVGSVSIPIILSYSTTGGSGSATVTNQTIVS
jgi:ribosomal protein L32